MTKKQLERAIENARHRVAVLELKLSSLRKDTDTWEISEDATKQLMRETFDNVAVVIAGIEFQPSEILAALDPTAYRTFLNDIEANLSWNEILRLDPAAEEHEDKIESTGHALRLCEDHIEILIDQLAEIDPKSPFIF